MNHKHQFLVIFTLVLCLYPLGGSAQDNDWIIGNWVTIGVSKEIAERKKEESNLPVEKHILLFLENGDFLRYSKEGKFSKMLLDFKIDGSTLFVRPPNKENFMIFGRKRNDGTLETYILSKGGILYKKLKIPYFDVNLEGTLPIVTIGER